ncbi:MAG: cytochrome b/b6 domain-containing protein [Mariprofundus sp.]
MNTTHHQVWDKFIRLFHWSLVVVFIVLYVSAHFKYDDTHFLFAYILMALLFSRIVWGFTSSGHAHFASFYYPIAETIAYFRSMLHGNSDRYIGHNPAGAAMTFTFLLLLIVMVVTGLVMLTWGEYEGPLWAMGIDFSRETALQCQCLHEMSTDLLLVMIALHLLGVMHSSFKHKENLASAMWHGKKRVPHDE